MEAPRITGYAFSEKMPAEMEAEDFSKIVLQPQEMLYSPMDKIYITAAGYLDDMLHIQLAVRDKTTLDTHGYLYLTDREGNRVDSYSSIFFMEEKEERVDYQEFLFRIPKEELGKYKLYGSFYKAGRNVQGNWRVTFSL